MTALTFGAVLPAALTLGADSTELEELDFAGIVAAAALPMSPVAAGNIATTFQPFGTGMPSTMLGELLNSDCPYVAVDACPETAAALSQIAASSRNTRAATGFFGSIAIAMPTLPAWIPHVRSSHSVFIEP